MRSEFAILCLVFVAGAQTLVAQPQSPRTHAPMFSRAYVNALQGVLEMEPRDAAALEKRLAVNPRDFSARLKLLAYDMRADRINRPESREQRVSLLFWLVAHQPDSEILSSPYGTLLPGDLSPDQAAQARKSWTAATGPRQTDARVFWNAANFYREVDPQMHIAFLERAVALAPGNDNYAVPLGTFYASAILAPDAAAARRAKQILDNTGNPKILEPAVRLLQSEYNKSIMMGKANTAVGALARQYFARAKALDPDLDQAWIYPAADPKMAGIFAPDFPRKALQQIRRLPPDAFPALPAAIRTQLRSRRCMIPQPAGASAVNVIQGEFFEKGAKAWAVLCSVDTASSILVFRNARDTHPEELAKFEDMNYVQGNGKGGADYSREIQPIDRKLIMENYRGSGGPEPPPIDHQGIDDEFLEKASVTFYWYRGAWRQLTGSD